MPTEWPSDDGGPFTLVEDDLEPLVAEYPGGRLLLPDGLEDLRDAPASNGITTAVPWQYVVTTQVFQRGLPHDREITIRGMTLVQGEGRRRAVPALHQLGRGLGPAGDVGWCTRRVRRGGAAAVSGARRHGDRPATVTRVQREL